MNKEWECNHCEAKWFVPILISIIKWVQGKFELRLIDQTKVDQMIAVLWLLIKDFGMKTIWVWTEVITMDVCVKISKPYWYLYKIMIITMITEEMKSMENGRANKTIDLAKVTQH